MHSITRTLLAALAVAALGQAGSAAAADKPLTVVELFTSQGCSSCPAADRLLGVLAKRDDLLPLSVHVDYWDYIGWKDAFAKPANGNRQRGYAARFQLKYVYTPQMVVDGAYQAVGSNESEIKGLIEKASADTHVAVELKRTGAGAEVVLPASQLEGAAEVVAVYFDRKHDVKVKRGENGGNTLSYHNVVRKMAPVALWRGEAKTIQIALPQGKDGGEACAVLIQMQDSRRIVGAARLPVSGS
jgi:hypothetical protein